MSEQLTPLERRVLAWLLDADPVFQPIEKIARSIEERRVVVYSALSELRKRDLVTVNRHWPKPTYACTTLGAAELAPESRRSRA